MSPPPLCGTLSLLGSTGSIGKSALDVVGRYPDRFTVAALASRSDWEGICAQARLFRPRLVALMEREAAERARGELAGTGISVLSGPEGVIEAAALPEADTVLSAIVGAAGVMPTFAAVQAGKRVALANKEALVVAGAVITAEAERTGAALIPVDSEHSAIFQCLLGQETSRVSRVILTASGGPFFGWTAERLATVKREEALAHPKWRMGPKVTVDSATLMNKGLEVMEARWLFGLPPGKIEVAVHPQSLVHSLVEFVDGSLLAQLGAPDMRLPIAFALTAPDRWPLPVERLDLFRAGKLEFFPPDRAAFPCLDLAYTALTRGQGAPAALNAANEVAVEAFLAGKLPFNGIPRVVAAVLAAAPPVAEDNLAALLRHDGWARNAARQEVSSQP